MRSRGELASLLVARLFAEDVPVAGIDRLHVLCPLPSDEALDTARLLAARGGGRMEPVRSLNDLGPALTRLLG